MFEDTNLGATHGERVTIMPNNNPVGTKNMWRACLNNQGFDSSTVELVQDILLICYG